MVINPYEVIYKAPSAKPNALTRRGPCFCAILPPSAPKKIHGNPNKATPALPIQCGAFKSSIMMTHNESYTPIITYSATPTRMDPSTARFFNKSIAKRSSVRSSTAVSVILRRAIMAPAMVMSTAIRMNGAARLMESTVSAAMTGPIAKPPTSIETPRPRLPPMFSGSLTMTIRLIAGIAIPAPTPMTKRPSKNSGSEDPKAMINAPAAFAAMPTVISLRACPRSAYGAIVS